MLCFVLFLKASHLIKLHIVIKMELFHGLLEQAGLATAPRSPLFKMMVTSFFTTAHQSGPPIPGIE